MTADRVSAGERGSRRPVWDSYARLSKKPDTGEFEKIEDQWADNRKVIERYGAELGKELDDGLSAWKRTVRRKGWEELLERVRSGVSDGIVVWHTDRLFRQPRDLETLIELGEKGFHVTSSHGQRDLADPDDRFILRIEVAHAARSSDDTQRRIKRRNAAKRQRGQRHVTGRGFGFPGRDRTVAPDENGHRPEVSASRVAAEVEAIRQAAAAVLAPGGSMIQVAREWNAAGLLGVTGARWTGPAVRDVLLRASNAGLIEYEGDIIREVDDGAEPILDRATWERLRAMCAGRRRGRAPGPVYAATGILRCGECGQKMSACPTGGKYRDGSPRRQYFCPKQRHGCGRVSADTRGVDAELRKFVIQRLSDSRYAATIAAVRADLSDRLNQVESDIIECERLQEDLAAKLGRRELTIKAFDAANAPLAESLARLRGEQDELMGEGPDGPGYAQPAERIAEQWDHAEPPERRTMLTQALGPHTMVVEKSGTGPKRRFDPNRVQLQKV